MPFLLLANDCSQAFELYKQEKFEESFEMYSHRMLEADIGLLERLTAYAGQTCCMYRLGYSFDQFNKQLHILHDEMAKLDECSHVHNYIYYASPFGEIMRELL